MSRTLFGTICASGVFLVHFVRVTDMDVGNLAYVLRPGGRRLTRRKLLLLLALICLPLLATGCIALSFGGCEHAEASGVLTQSGKVTCKCESQVTVYYPVPYASPPNLEIHDQARNFSLLEQRADCFRIVQVSPGLPNVDWTARGVRSPATIAPSTSDPAPSVPPATVPQEPLPVTGTNPNR
jgi:hypothetical protein